LTLYQADADAFTSDHLRVLQVITSKVGHFIENALKYRHAEDSATSDFLTGLPNARALSIHLDQELARCRRDDSTLAVLECDLNNFKEVNDRYGHLAGDKVLKIFANSIREVCREYDFTARMGGDDILSLSLGAAFYPVDGLDAEQLLAEADRRMYRAKQSHYKLVQYSTSKSHTAASFSLEEGNAYLGPLN
jgi:GGDEF domain-containing protein